MVYTAVPPDYCDTDAGVMLQQAPSGVNSFEKLSLEKERLDNGGGKIDLTFKILGYYLSCS